MHVSSESSVESSKYVDTPPRSYYQCDISFKQKLPDRLQLSAPILVITKLEVGTIIMMFPPFCSFSFYPLLCLVIITTCSWTFYLPFQHWISLSSVCAAVNLIWSPASLHYTFVMSRSNLTVASSSSSHSFPSSIHSFPFPFTPKTCSFITLCQLVLSFNISHSTVAFPHSHSFFRLKGTRRACSAFL